MFHVEREPGPCQIGRALLPFWQIKNLSRTIAFAILTGCTNIIIMQNEKWEECDKSEIVQRWDTYVTYVDIDTGEQLEYKHQPSQWSHWMSNADTTKYKNYLILKTNIIYEKQNTTNRIWRHSEQQWIEIGTPIGRKRIIYECGKITPQGNNTNRR